MGVWPRSARGVFGAWTGLACTGLVCAGLLAAALAGGIAAGAEPDGSDKTGDKTRTPMEKSRPDRLPDKPTVPPAFTIPIGGLGFSAPGSIYLGQRFSMASLDFLDEDRLLFTFRVPGLIHRQGKSGEDDGDERHIKAVVLALPSGVLQAEAVWALHDRSRYLWMLKDGRFLVRDRNQLEEGDATLELKPYLRFPGLLLGVDLNPSQELLVTNSHEPAQVKAKADEVASPSTASASIVRDQDSQQDPPRTEAPQPSLVVRILERETGKVMLVSRALSQVHLPINAEGYLELLPGRGMEWMVNLNKFGGGFAKLGEVESACTPSYDFISEREFMVNTCTRSDVRAMVAMAVDGRKLWEDQPSSSPVWPVMVTSADGSRLARESLAVNHSVNAFAPISFEDVKGQLVEVFDAATGKIVLAAPASPVFDAGGNVAISPSGRRVAVLSAGAIEVFELPAAPGIPPAPEPEQAAKPGP